MVLFDNVVQVFAKEGAVNRKAKTEDQPSNGKQVGYMIIRTGNDGAINRQGSRRARAQKSGASAVVRKPRRLTLGTGARTERSRSARGGRGLLTYSEAAHHIAVG